MLLEIAVHLAVAGGVYDGAFCAVLFPTRCLGWDLGLQLSQFLRTFPSSYCVGSVCFVRRFGQLAANNSNHFQVRGFVQKKCVQVRGFQFYSATNASAASNDFTTW